MSGSTPIRGRRLADSPVMTAVGSTDTLLGLAGTPKMVSQFPSTMLGSAERMTRITTGPDGSATWLFSPGFAKPPHVDVSIVDSSTDVLTDKITSLTATGVTVKITKTTLLVLALGAANVTLDLSARAKP